MRTSVIALLCVTGLGCAGGQKSTAEIRHQEIQEYRAQQEQKNNLALGSTWRSTEGFQNSRWGMTPDEVKALAKGPVEEKAGALWSTETVAGNPAVLTYRFANGSLAAVDVQFQPVPDVSPEMEKFRQALTAKYGAPKEAIEVNLVQQAKEYFRIGREAEAEERRAQAFARALTYPRNPLMTYWRTPDTRTVLWGDNSTKPPSLSITYLSSDLAPALKTQHDEEKAAEKQRREDDLKKKAADL